jgi:hypothetical protein
MREASCRVGGSIFAWRDVVPTVLERVLRERAQDLSDAIDLASDGNREIGRKGEGACPLRSRWVNADEVRDDSALSQVGLETPRHGP